MNQEPLPDWLAPRQPIPNSDEIDIDPDHPDDHLTLVPRHTKEELAIIEEGKRARKELTLMRFEHSLDTVLSHIARGNPLTAALEDYPFQFEYSKYLAWLLKDEDRKRRYYEAQEIGAEVVAQQMLTIADAEDSVEDVARSTLRINTRKWLLGVWNRKRFGEVKQIDQTVTIDLTSAMAEAQARVDAARTVDVQGRIVR
jgi:hypothetical protein